MRVNAEPDSCRDAIGDVAGKDRRVQTLEGLRMLLEKKTKSPIVFRTVNTRLVLRTGINLLAIRPEQSMDPECVDRVAGVLNELGYGVAR